MNKILNVTWTNSSTVEYVFSVSNSKNIHFEHAFVLKKPSCEERCRSHLDGKIGRKERAIFEQDSVYAG